MENSKNYEPLKALNSISQYATKEFINHVADEYDPGEAYIALVRQCGILQNAAIDMATEEGYGPYEGKDKKKVEGLFLEGISRILIYLNLALFKYIETANENSESDITYNIIQDISNLIAKYIDFDAYTQAKVQVDFSNEIGAYGFAYKIYKDLAGKVDNYHLSTAFIKEMIEKYNYDQMTAMMIFSIMAKEDSLGEDSKYTGGYR